MADTQNDQRGEIVTSIHGRRLGLDKNEFLVTKGTRAGITAATSATTGTVLPNNGVITIDSTTGDTHVIDDPVPGCSLFIVGLSTTGTNTFTASNATFLSCEGTTGGSIQIVGNGGVHLVGVSTALWAPVGALGTTAKVFVTT